MATFLEYYHSTRAPGDYFWALISAVVYAGNLLVNKAAEASPPNDQAAVRYQAWEFSVSASSLLVAAAISTNRSIYLRKRTGWLVAVKLVGFLTVGTLLQPFVALLPRVMKPVGDPPSSALLQLAMIAEQGMLLLLSALGWQLPMRTHLWVQAVGLLRMLSILPAQCAAQCGHPGYSHLYQRLASWLAGACGRVFPVTVAARRDGPPLLPCMAVNTWVLAVLGYVMPTLYLHWAQARLQQRYLADVGQARHEPVSQPSLTAWLHVGMAAIALPVVWRGVELGMLLWNALALHTTGAGLPC